MNKFWIKNGWPIFWGCIFAGLILTGVVILSKNNSNLWKDYSELRHYGRQVQGEIIRVEPFQTTGGKRKRGEQGFYVTFHYFDQGQQHKLVEKWPARSITTDEVGRSVIVYVEPRTGWAVSEGHPLMRAAEKIEEKKGTPSGQTEVPGS